MLKRILVGGETLGLLLGMKCRTQYIHKLCTSPPQLFPPVDSSLLTHESVRSRVATAPAHGHMPGTRRGFGPWALASPTPPGAAQAPRQDQTGWHAGGDRRRVRVRGGWAARLCGEAVQRPAGHPHRTVRTFLTGD